MTRAIHSDIPMNDDRPTQVRKYVPTAADLLDRLSIVLLKSIFIPQNRDSYREEITLIEHDLGLETVLPRRFTALEIRALLVMMLANRYIWENETKARAATGSEQDKLLKLTHSINGVRNAAKNIIAKRHGERVDLKVDCLAADLDPSFGNWNVFEDVK
jgi:hypothetical protein